MSVNLWMQISDYFFNNSNDYWVSVKAHMEISFYALLLSALIGITCGHLCVKHKQYERWIVSLFQVLRIVPSLAVLLLLIPIMGTGTGPAMVALVLLAIPPILMNTVAGLEAVPPFLLEAAYGAGMSDRQVLWKVKFPLAAPIMLTGIKTAAIEIIASATLAAKIGAGGLGGIIFTGLGLNRMDLLLVGGISVAMLSVAAGLSFDLTDRFLFKYKFVRK
ncbi:osmoprotectant transport system permease protein [Paenibacillus algorifonticola]|uniref:Osmoprotectant transport system permease protein n=1 Tax=Paenibacillus algorifonticola TaxID=684063 RepID=A0A1I1YVN8_9BACL|nr:ABC transporter permease [Paenibacillus algorifonticola]SFE23665.1 osmoprotectant transport system permease protein [Paenibacillus algorifonticola]